MMIWCQLDDNGLRLKMMMEIVLMLILGRSLPLCSVSDVFVKLGAPG